MSIAEQSKNIFNQSMRNNIPGWDTLSSVDPMKIFAEGVIGSLTEIEKISLNRYRRVLDQLPALFGFTSRKASLPVGFFELVPSELMKRPLIIEKNIFFQYKLGVETWDLFTLEALEIRPLRVISSKIEDTDLKLVLELYGECSALEFYFFPPKRQAKEQPFVNQYKSTMSLEIWNSETSRFDIIYSDSYKIQKVEQDWNRPTLFKISSTNPSKNIFNASNTKFQVTWTFEGASVPKGNFRTNIARCKLGQNKERMAIGTLKGEAWEEMLLPLDLPQSPSQLELEYPNGDSIEIELIESEILKIHTNDFNQLNQRFIYDPVHHQIIIPGSFIHVGQYRGGVSVIAKKQLCFPVDDWISKDAKLDFNGFNGQVETILPVEIEISRILQEKPSEYLERFYSTFREFMARDNSLSRAMISWDDLRLRLIETAAEIQSVELIANELKRHVKVAVVEYSGLHSSASLVSEKTRFAIEEKLKRELPIQYSWEILPAVKKIIYLTIRLKFKNGEKTLSTADSQSLHLKLKYCCDQISQTRKSQNLIRVEDFHSAIQNEIQKYLKNLESSDIPELEITLIHPDTLEITTNISRDQGVFFTTDCTIFCEPYNARSLEVERINLC